MTDLLILLTAFLLPYLVAAFVSMDFGIVKKSYAVRDLMVINFLIIGVLTTVRW